MKEITSVCILGAGNLAFHLGKSIKKAGIEILQVYNRTETAGIELAKELECSYISDLNKINENVHLILFCVSDSAISQILESRSWDNKLLVHTSGSLSLDIFKSYSGRFGVIYPLQTFTKGRKIDFYKIPLFIQGNSSETLALLYSFCNRISEKIIKIDSDKKVVLHLAAVFANNFINHLLTIAYELLKQNKLPAEYLYPLIEETVHKAMEMDPKLTQTGPAVRNDLDTINNHIEMLSKKPEWQKIYTFVSENIQKYYNSRHD